ncbi:RNA polymerase sigma factor [Deinococcus malanensis]|nr:sigma-70 family RNA polymerase sigma factor [Deinococcus malanensis]
MRPPGGQSIEAAHDHLIAQLQYGEESALKALYDDLSGVTYRVCLRMLGTPADAEEVLQDTFLRLEVQAQRYDPTRGTVRTFVLTIAQHLCLERLRSRRSRPQRQEDPSRGPVPDLAAPAPAGDPLDAVVIRDALDRLSTTDRELLEAMFFDGYTHAEITARTGLPLGTVKSRLRRALLKLRQRMLP